MLTDSLIQSILPATRPIKKADGGGLNICVLPGGRREWRLIGRLAAPCGQAKQGDGGVTQNHDLALRDPISNVR